MQTTWVAELWRLMFVLSIAAVVGLLLDQFMPALFVGLLAYIARNLFNLQRFVNWLDHPQRDRIPHHFGIWGDIYSRVQRRFSGHHQRERRLGEVLAQFQASVGAFPDAAVALGPQGEIRWFNDKAQELLRLRAPADLGQPLVNLFRTPVLVSFLDKRDFEKAIEIPAPGDLQRQLSVRVTPYGEGQLLLLAQDITERVRSEQMRRDFVANVSHELRTPLTVVSGFVENMRMDVPEEVAHWNRPLQLIDEQARRMQSLVEDLLLLARLEAGELSSGRDLVDMQQLCQLMAEEARSMSDELDVDVRLETDLRLRGNRDQLRSAFSNLVSNAVHYTPPGGSISLIWQEEQGRAVFTVEDTGEGIGPEHIARLTERFYRVDAGRSRERGGTGLGLAIVKHVLQVHGATLEIDSQLGAGSRFSCVFSAAEAQPSSEEAVETTEPLNKTA